jgi:hypothetical protein
LRRARGGKRRVLGYGEEVIVEVMIWFLVYLVLMLAMSRWRDHLDAARSQTRRRAKKARNGGVLRRQQVALRPGRDQGRPDAEHRQR